MKDYLSPKMFRYLLLILLMPGAVYAADLDFYGDIVLSRGIEKFAEEKGTQTVVDHIRPFLLDDAIHIGNLEGAAGGNKFSCAGNHYPCFPIREKYLPIIDGFDVINLENNHSLDLGFAGFNNTISELKKRNIIPLGGNSYSTIIETEKGNIAIVGVTDVINNKNDRQYLAMADSPRIFREIERLRKICTVVAVYIHWGRELDNLPTDRMKALAAKYINAGADLIVGTHPHVVGKVVCINGRPVVYSLGNFLFDQKYDDTKKGAVLKCAIDDGDNMKCRLTGIQTPRNSYLPYSIKEDVYKNENEILSSCRVDVQKTWTGFFSSDKKKKRLLLKKDGKNSASSYLELYDLTTGKKELKTPSMPIVKLQPVDVNTDGILEIMLIQNVYSPLDEETAKRVYIYSMDKKFHALWRGSALSRPLLDALFVKNKNQQPVLVGLHTTDSFLIRKPEKPGRIVMSYHWNGFGFSGVKELMYNINSSYISYSKQNINLYDNNKFLIQKVPFMFLN